MLNTTTSLLAVTALTLAGCKSTPAAPAVDPDFAPSAAKVKTHLATLAKIKQTVDATAALAHDTLALPNGQRASSTLVTVDQLTALGECFPDAMICNDLWWRLSGCDRISKLTAEKAAEEFGAVAELKRCAGLRYLAVVRKRAFTRPSADKDSKTFDRGSISVELLVFDLESAAYLGGFLVDAKNPESLEVSASTNVGKMLHEHLGRLIYDAMRKRIDT